MNIENIKKQFPIFNNKVHFVGNYCYYYFSEKLLVTPYIRYGEQF